MEGQRRITCAGEADTKCQQGKPGEDIEIQVEALVGTPFVKGKCWNWMKIYCIEKDGNQLGKKKRSGTKA